MSRISLPPTELDVVGTRGDDTVGLDRNSSVPNETPSKKSPRTGKILLAGHDKKGSKPAAPADGRGIKGESAVTAAKGSWGTGAYGEFAGEP